MGSLLVFMPAAEVAEGFCLISSGLVGRGGEMNGVGIFGCLASFITLPQYFIRIFWGFARLLKRGCSFCCKN